MKLLVLCSEFKYCELVTVRNKTKYKTENYALLYN